MKDFKKQLQALVKIGEKILLLLVGAAALTLSILDPRFETLRSAIQVTGALCLILGLSPMVTAYVKANLPKVEKKK